MVGNECAHQNEPSASRLRNCFNSWMCTGRRAASLHYQDMKSPFRIKNTWGVAIHNASA